MPDGESSMLSELCAILGPCNTPGDLLRRAREAVAQHHAVRAAAFAEAADVCANIAARRGRERTPDEDACVHRDLGRGQCAACCSAWEAHDELRRLARANGG